MSSVARRVALSGASILVATLLVVGIGTGVVLHTRQVRALDDALSAAAQGRAHPEVPVDVEVEHGVSAIETWLVSEGDRRVPAALVRKAFEHEGPLLADVGGERIALVPFEVEQADEERKGLAAAAAQKVTIAESVGPFIVAYSLLAVVASALASLAQVQAVRRAFRPLDRTRAEAASVLALGEGSRLTVDGPVEIRALIEAINDLLVRLEAAHEAQARFTAEAAHELRTPVTAMLGELDVALRAEAQGHAPGPLLSSLREEVDRLRRLVEGLVALARIDAGQIEKDRELLRAGELADRAVAAEARTLERAGCELLVHIDHDSQLEGHGAMLEVALANLLRNAARHAAGTRVELRVGRQGDLALFQVDDSGPGVCAEDREALFDRFARAPRARQRDREGLGLGLPLAREVARRHGGDCTLHPSPSGGLQVKLTVRALQDVALDEL